MTPVLNVSFLVFLFLMCHHVSAQTKISDINPSERRIKVNPGEIGLGRIDTASFLVNLQKKTDALIFDEKVNLRRRLSIVNEDTLSVVWSPTWRLVEVADQVLIDSIWVTAFEHYALWDNDKINTYDFEPKDFKDTVTVKLYDPYFEANWSAPLEGTEINSDFGLRRWRWHHGTDLKLKVGDPVKAVFDGIVRIRTYERYGYGHYLVLRHKNGLETLYGHLSAMNVDVGQEVKAGEIIGAGGNTGRSTGPHLHFEVRYQGLSVNPNELFDFNIGRIKNDTYTITANSFEHVIKMREAIYHRVRRGENLSVIAKRYGVSIRHITRLNGIRSGSILNIGQRLKIR